MNGPTKCWHCGLITETNGGMIWAIIRVIGYLDEYDVTLCSVCAQALFATLAHFPRKPSPSGSAIADIEQQRSRMRDV